MKLYLMRHGQAASKQVDPEQGLTAGGKAEIKKLARQLAGQNVQVAQIYHSEKTRARQTAEIMSRFIAPDVIPKAHAHITPNDDPHTLLPEINEWQIDTLITSHLPFVPNLLTLLIENSSAIQNISFVPGTVVCLLKEDSAWSIEWVASP